MQHNNPNPFHAGERAAQNRAGVGDVSKWAGGFVRDYLPQQHREFHSSLPFLVLSGSDGSGRVWTTLVEGDDGFIRSPDPQSLTLQTSVDPADPLALRFSEGGDIGGIGIELATRRRNRFSGQITPGGTGMTIKVRQTFGNCPQYIHTRSLRRAPRSSEQVTMQSDRLSDTQIATIRQANTMFIGSGHQGTPGAASNGYDASHRGGPAGFVHVAGQKHLQIPDYAGNNFFNTIGNILSDPRVGLLFVDFEAGGLLHITGRAKIDWAPRGARDPDAWRMINVEIDKVIERPGAVSLRWTPLDTQSRKLRLIRREKASENITSFYLAPADGRPLDPFEPGQHLPISVQIPGQSGMTDRSYSLSGSASHPEQYRLSVKREENGLVSRFLHDHLEKGDMIEVQPPEGDFAIPEGDGPVVLVSAGVGLTPMVSMLHTLATGNRTVWYVHGARNKRDHALRGEVADLVAQNDNLQQRVFYSQPENGDLADHSVHCEGRVTARDLLELEAGSDAHYMLCGPRQFLADIQNGLEDLGVPPEHVFFETFGPTGTP